jgi:hypothetical protein
VSPHFDAAPNVMSVNRCFARCTSRQRHENSSGWMAMYCGRVWGATGDAFDVVGGSHTGRRLPRVVARLSHAFPSSKRNSNLHPQSVLPQLFSSSEAPHRRSGGLLLVRQVGDSCRDGGGSVFLKEMARGQQHGRCPPSTRLEPRGRGHRRGATVCAGFNRGNRHACPDSRRWGRVRADSRRGGRREGGKDGFGQVTSVCGYR